jgi:hypothetical protein
MSSSALNEQDVRLGGVADRFKLGALGAGAVGLLASLAIYFTMAPDRFFRAYLTAFMLVLGISLAALVFVMIFHATRTGWGIVVRRLLEGMASNLLWLWVLFIPVALAMLFSEKTHLYEWNIDAVVQADTILQGKRGFLNAGFWLARAALYFSIWGFLAWFYLRHSVAQDASGDVAHTDRMQRLAPVGILAYALTTSLAALDWMKSLEPHWFSTIFGVYFFAASCAASFAFLILLVLLLQRLGKLQGQITPEHYQDMGKLLFAFGVCFWGYIAFSQFMLIWYGNLPEETIWFLARGQGGWYGVSMVIFFGHFLIPFVGFMSRHMKRRRATLVTAATWMLVMAFVDFYWIIIPQVPADLLARMQAETGMDHPAFVSAYENDPVPVATLEAKHLDPKSALSYADVYGFHPTLADVTCLIGVLGLFAGLTLQRLGRAPLVPVSDPRLHESLAFENV